MHIHILGIAGTFMSALAILAKAQGHQVTGHDEKCYPPISDLLTAHGIAYIEGYEVEMASILKADMVVVGNAMKRGMPIIELLLNAKGAYTSGPAWLASNILKNYKVMAVSGTHGKTSTSTMIAYIMTEAGCFPSYLLGGVPQCLPANAKLDKGEWFIIEADEYDTAFFDKRPKFMHYRPQGLIVNNLEFDHADIYPSLDAIILQFHYLFRTVPENGFIIRPKEDKAIDEACQKGVYTPMTTIGGDYHLTSLSPDGSQFRLSGHGRTVDVAWSLMGRHNMENAAAAMLACLKMGVSLEASAKLLKHYQPVKRRLELCFQSAELTVFDDFAHHPTAIRRTTETLREAAKYNRILAVLEFGSNSMRAGHHLQGMPQALAAVDCLYALDLPGLNLREMAQMWPCEVKLFADIHRMIEGIVADLKPQDVIVMMSNKGFGQLKPKLIETLKHQVHA